MKTIEEILNQKAKENHPGYELFTYLFDDQLSDTRIKDLVNVVFEAMQEYAKQSCDEQIRECFNNASVKQESEYIDSLTGYAVVSRIDEDSILNTPNVVTTK